MKEKLAAVIKKERFALLILLGALATFVAISPLAAKVLDFATKRSIGLKTELVQSSLNGEQDQALQKMKEVVAVGTFNQDIKKNDVSAIASLLADEGQKQGLSTLVAVNKDGIALSRIPATGGQGDYVFQTTPWGRVAAGGTPTVMIGVGRSFPLVMIAAVPIMEQEKVAGAIFGGYWLNDDYAKTFKEKYLQSGVEIAFYSKEEGAVGMSFEDIDSQMLVHTAFNAGTDWAQNGQTDRIVDIKGKDYFVRNIVFPGEENVQDSPGGVFVFLPYNIAYQNFGIAFLSTLIFLLIAIYVHRRHRGETIFQKYYAGILIGGSCCIIFFGLWYLGSLNSGKQIIRIREPQFVIYNSTLRFQPDQNIFDRAFEQKIAIRLDSGGEAINAVQVIVDYDPAIVQVNDIVTANSLCGQQFFLKKNIDNKKGEVQITCGLPTPGFTGRTGTVAELMLQPVAVGAFALRFGSGTEVLANDGLGTNVLRAVTNGSYRITSLEMRQTATNVPPGVIVFSPSHLNSERWYNVRRAQFTWPTVSGYQYAYVFDQSPTSTPRGGTVTWDGMVILNPDHDGIYYFHIAAKKGNTLGPISHFRVNIDATPPLPPVIQASKTKIKPGEVVRFQFSGSDALSGLQPNYYVKIDNSIFIPTLSRLDIPFLENGVHTIGLRTFDNARNFSDANMTIEVSK